MRVNVEGIDSLDVNEHFGCALTWLNEAIAAIFIHVSLEHVPTLVECWLNPNRFACKARMSSTNCCPGMITY